MKSPFPRGPASGSAAFVKGFSAAFLGLLLLAELFCRWGSAQGIWYRHWDFTGNLVGAAEAGERLDWASRRGPWVLALGDSVLGPTSLLENRRPNAKSSTLARELDEAAGASGQTVLSLGADGILIPDLEGLVALAGRHSAPQQVLLILNARMFAPQYRSGTQALSREFLQPYLAGDRNGLSLPGWGDSAERHWALFRVAQLFKTLWYVPTQKAAIQRWLESLGLGPADEDLRLELLKRQIAPFYDPAPWDELSPPFQALDRLLEDVRGRGLPVLVAFSPQNASFLGSDLDQAAFRRNRERLGGFIRARLADPKDYLDLAEGWDPSLFLDHCHLTPEGNRKLASRLWAALPQRTADPGGHHE